VIALTDENGNVVARYNYGPWGETDIVHDDDGSGVANPIRYTGREMDETGLYYYRARYYSPEMGRFISEDPIGFGGGDVNFYSYVGNRPVNVNDPLGLFAPAIAAVPAVAEAVVAGVGIISGMAIGDWIWDNFFDESSEEDACPVPPVDTRDKYCKQLWISDTKWCDNNFRRQDSFACHQWAQQEYYRCLAGEPRQPFYR